MRSAERSIDVLESSYRYFDHIQDRAGQHHTLEMGLTMLDRARWTGKLEEAEVYRRWLVGKLSRPLVENSGPVAMVAEPVEQHVEDCERQLKEAA